MDEHQPERYSITPFIAPRPGDRRDWNDLPPLRVRHPELFPPTLRERWQASCDWWLRLPAAVFLLALLFAVAITFAVVGFLA